MADEVSGPSFAGSLRVSTVISLRKSSVSGRCRMHSPHEVNAAITLKATLREAALYWEPRRIGYNMVLAVVVAAWFALTWPHLRPALSMH